MVIKTNVHYVNYQHVGSVDVVRVPTGYAVCYHMNDLTDIFGDSYTEPNFAINLADAFKVWKGKQ